MAGNCNLHCYECQCSCKECGTHSSCMNCRECKPNDKHDRK